MTRKARGVALLGAAALIGVAAALWGDPDMRGYAAAAGLSGLVTVAIVFALRGEK